MIKVTWEWLGQGLALDLADTVTVELGVENDLVASNAEYARWAERETAFLPDGYGDALETGRNELLALRTAVRDALIAAAAGHQLPRGAIDRLNSASRCAPAWIELDRTDLTLQERTSATPIDALVALYARSAIDLLATESGRIRRCPAPSCGMFYVNRRRQQRWCSPQCGTRARVARHYAAHREARQPSGGDDILVR